MAKVTGIGGIFFRARNPKALQKWYVTHLGLPEDDGYVTFRHHDEPSSDAYALWAPFKVDTDYFGSRDQMWMVNFRVDDLDGMLEKLREAGAEVAGDIEESDYGRFGWATDPEGNRFELWEPPSEPPFTELVGEFRDDTSSD